jgi:hypothetical protein
VPRQGRGDRQVGDREDRENPDFPTIERGRQRAFETIQAVEAGRPGSLSDR